MHYQCVCFTCPVLNTSDYNVVIDIRAIKKKFREVKMVTRSNIQEKVPNTDVFQLVDIIMDLPVDHDDDEEYLSKKISTLREAKRVDAVLDHLNFHWDYLHPDLYSYLIDEFNFSHLTPLISQYETDLNEFLDKTPLKAFCSVEKMRTSNMKLPSEKFKHLVTGHCWSDPVYLSHVKNFQKKCAECVGLRQCAFRIYGILNGSVIITQWVPVSIEMKIKSIDQNFLRSHNIVYMNFNGSIIYKEVRTVNV